MFIRFLNIIFLQYFFGNLLRDFNFCLTKYIAYFSNAMFSTVVFYWRHKGLILCLIKQIIILLMIDNLTLALDSVLLHRITTFLLMTINLAWMVRLHRILFITHLVCCSRTGPSAADQWLWLNIGGHKLATFNYSPNN